MQLLGLLLLAGLILVVALVGPLTPEGEAGLWASVASCMVIFAFLAILLPFRYEVWPADLRIVFPLFGWDLHFDSIEEVWQAPWRDSGVRAIRLGTSSGRDVVVRRIQPRLFTRPNFVLSIDSLEECDVFFVALERALKHFQDTK